MGEVQAAYNNSHALVVGINSYSDPRFMPLGNAEADATTFGQLISQPPYNFQVTTLLGAQATRQAILDALHNLRRTGADDRVLVYFAGHGYTLTDRFGSETGYLAAADTIPDKDFTALQMDEVTGLIRHAQAKHIAFIFDACFSGQALGLTRAPAVAAEKFMQRRAFQVLSAGSGDQVVSDFHSMTSSLIDAIKSGIANEDGLVTFSELGLFLQQSIAADSGQTQIPQFGHLRGSQGGDFIFLHDPGPRLPSEIGEALRSNLSNIRLGAAVDLVHLAHTGVDIDLTSIARERLTELAQSDLDERVRAAAQSFFDERTRLPDESTHLRLERVQKAREIVPEKPALPSAPAPQPEQFFYPNAWALNVFQAAEQVIGRESLEGLLIKADLGKYLEHYPLDNMKRVFPFGDFGRLWQAVYEVYGQRGASSVGKAAGAKSFEDGLKTFGAIANVSRAAMERASASTRNRIGLEFFAHYFNNLSDQRVEIEDTPDHWVWRNTRCPMCWGWHADEPVCYLGGGVLQAALAWVDGKQRRIVETECIAKGDQACVFRIDKS